MPRTKCATSYDPDAKSHDEGEGYKHTPLTASLSGERFDAITGCRECDVGGYLTLPRQSGIRRRYLARVNTCGSTIYKSQCPDSIPFIRYSSTRRQCAAAKALSTATMAAMLEFRTQGYNPYAVKYSPYYDSRLAVATSANFGIVGNGRLFALGMSAQGIQVEKTYVWKK